MKMQSPLKNRKELFWEVSPDDVESLLVNNAEWVVPRVFEYGTMYDIYDVIDLYGESRVKEVLKNSQLGDIASAIAFIIFDIPKKSRNNASFRMRHH
jgi:cyanate lyase